MAHSFSVGEIALIISILVHASATIWWASKMNTTMTFIKLELERTRNELTKRDEQITAIWAKIDKLQQKVYSKNAT